MSDTLSDSGVVSDDISCKVKRKLVLKTLSYFSGLLSTSGIYQDLHRWVQACLCSSEIALYNLRNVEAWPAHDGQERWTVSVISSTYTHTHTNIDSQGPTPPFISIAR